MPNAKSNGRQRPPGRIQVLPIEKLVPTPDNRRKAISDASVRSLAQSIKKDGLLQPLVVRVHPSLNDRWEIRAGERRWRAAKLAGLTALPVIVRKLDNETALAVTIVENLQRKDLHPLEEAETIQLAFDREYDVKSIAAKLGKSAAYIARRASLTRIAPIWKSEIRKPNSEASRLSAAHLELIARLPESTQTMLADDGFFAVFGRGFPTVEELRRVIDQDLHSLVAMPWDVDDETLDPKAGSCLNCPKRSSKEPMLFPEADSSSNGKASKNDRCLDPQCFDGKQLAHVERCENRLRADHPGLRLVQLGVGTLSPAVQHALGDRIERMYAAKMVKSSHPQAVPVIQVDGPKAGKLVFLDLGESEGTGQNGRHGRPRDANGTVVPMTLAERRERLAKRRAAMAVKKVESFLRELTPEKSREIVSPWTQRRNNKAKGTVVFDATALLSVFGTTRRADFIDEGEAWKAYDSLRETEPIDHAAAALLAVAEVWIKRLAMQNNEHALQQAIDAKRMCEILGLDFAAMEEEAKVAIPQPKSWEGLRDVSSFEATEGNDSPDLKPPWKEDDEVSAALSR